MPRDALIAFTGSASLRLEGQPAAAQWRRRALTFVGGRWVMDLDALRCGTRERALRQWMQRGGRPN